jgi:UDP:flavonoid glycosyltransferase YjiC (YdhE family)
MSYEEFKDKLTAAGMKFDGHVTHGSIEEQLKVINEWSQQIGDEVHRVITGEPL